VTRKLSVSLSFYIVRFIQYTSDILRGHSSLDYILWIQNLWWVGLPWSYGLQGKRKASLSGRPLSIPIGTGPRDFQLIPRLLLVPSSFIRSNLSLQGDKMESIIWRNAVEQRLIRTRGKALSVNAYSQETFFFPCVNLLLHGWEKI
jgi:hypothetical protein